MVICWRGYSGEFLFFRQEVFWSFFFLSGKRIVGGAKRIRGVLGGILIEIFIFNHLSILTIHA